MAPKGGLLVRPDEWEFLMPRPGRFVTFGGGGVSEIIEDRQLSPASAKSQALLLPASGPSSFLALLI